MGPALRGAPACPGGGGGGGQSPSAEAGVAGDKWAKAQLSLDGEDLVGRCFLPQYLYLARALLVNRRGRTGGAVFSGGTDRLLIVHQYVTAP